MIYMAPELYIFLEVGSCIALRMEEETEILGEHGRSQRCRMPGQFREVHKADIADILMLPAQ